MTHCREGPCSVGEVLRIELFQGVLGPFRDRCKELTERGPKTARFPNTDRLPYACTSIRHISKLLSSNLFIHGCLYCVLHQWLQCLCVGLEPASLQVLPCLSSKLLGSHQLLGWLGIGLRDKNNQNAHNGAAHNVIDALACGSPKSSASNKTA